MKRSSPIAAVLAASFAACASPPPGLTAPEDPVVTLDLAGERLAAEDVDAGLWLLQTIEPEELTGEDAARYDLLLAAALHGTGKSWKAYRQLRDFFDDHRFSIWTPQVESLHYQIGAWLIQSDGGLWILQSDREDGETVLLDFVERFPTSRLTDDALRLLGENAMEDESWLIARRRFEQILADHPASEWAPLARFRIAQSAFRDLVGPAYDLRAMRLARNELRDFLAGAPEQPEFRSEAERSLATVEDWIARRHWMDAGFYRTVDSASGERAHLQLVLAECPDHESIPAARRRLAELDALLADGAPEAGR